MRSIENRQPEHHPHPPTSPESPTLSEAKKKTIRSLQLGSLGLQTAGTIWEIAQNGLGAVNTRILLLMAHDVNDVAGWELDLRQDRGKLSEAARRRTEKMAHWAIAGGGAYTAVEGGTAAAGIRWHEGGHNLLNTIAATGATGVAAATTGLVAAAVMKKYGSVKQLWRQARGGDAGATKDKKRLMHGVTDFLTAGAVLSDTTELLSSQSSSVLAALSGLACAVYFRPTKKNLELGHVCVAHDHDHVEDDHDVHGREHHHHHHDEYREQYLHEVDGDDKKQLRQRRAARLGTVAAAVVASGVIAGSIFGGNNSSMPQESMPSHVGSSIVEQRMAMVQNGDSIWRLVHEHAESTTGVRPSEAAIWNLVRMTASMNSTAVSNPNVIHPGYSLLLPSDEQVRAEILYN